MKYETQGVMDVADQMSHENEKKSKFLATVFSAFFQNQAKQIV
jgi:hypothetical protein